MVQLLPFASEAVIARLEENTAALAHVSALLEAKKSLTELADIALAGIEYDVFDTLEVGYRCDCSRSRMRRALLSVGGKELTELFAEQVAEGKPEELELGCRILRSDVFFHEGGSGLKFELLCRCSKYF